MQSNKKVNFLAGLFILAGAVALLFLALQSANLSSFSTSKTYEVKAYFDNIGGLKVRAPIKSAGVTVGRVKSVAYDNVKYEARVILAIDSQYEFPTDTSAKILTSGLLGEQYIGLSPGADEENLQDGSQILITQSAVVLENLISQFLFNTAEANSKTSEQESK
ncbi:MAG: outer membrane lipid asymmetry maintenance protein MlaD [Burkholderiales bacterium]|nr:outer membrane lipid asymmetry maintenance protein MlaD [Burkholderiales bacterium]